MYGYQPDSLKSDFDCYESLVRSIHIDGYYCELHIPGVRRSRQRPNLRVMGGGISVPGPLHHRNDAQSPCNGILPQASFLSARPLEHT